MINRQGGQLRIGRSGPIVVGEQPPEDMHIKQELPNVTYRKRLKKVKRKSSKIVHRDRKDRNKRKMRASLSDIDAEEQTDTQVTEESQITRQESIRFIRPELHTEEPSTDKLAVDESSAIHKAHKKSHKDRRIEKFDRLIKENKDSGRKWYYGMEGKWWWGMSEEEARKHFIESESQRELKRELKKKVLGSRVRTIGEIIDEMKAKYRTELPNDPIKRISYIYPINSTHSFNIVATNHIKYLRHMYIVENDNIEIEEIDWSQLSNINWNEKRSVLIHPFLYPFASYESFMQNSRNFAKLLATKHKIGGFDVADSTKISKIAVDLINKIDIMMVPSNFVKDVYIKSGVTIPIEILPHGIMDEFLGDYPIYTDNVDITRLRKMKEKGSILILYFLVHSSHRKGADLVENVMKKIQDKYKNVYLIVKSKDKDYFSKVRSICLESWMSNDDLRLLYDTCDVCLSPSRGGGFELNALEAVSRGLPTLVTNGGCFLDLIDYFIPINLSDKVTQPLPGNPIHIGIGYEADIDDFEAKLTDVINRLDYWKEHFKGNIKEIREKYTWRESARILDQHLKKHGFIE